MSEYLMRLICAAILCALIDALCGTGAGMRRLTAGIFLTLVAFSLPTKLELPELQPEHFFREAEQAAAQGEALARDARAECITKSFEAYIQSKAEEMGLEVSARITLDEQLLPCRVELWGTASVQERQALSETISLELGMGEEDVVWTDSHQSSE